MITARFGMLESSMTYPDHNAQLTVKRSSLEDMMPVLEETFDSPSSNHRSGMAASRLVKDARRKVDGSISMGAADVIFTAGTTETNNLALAELRAGLGRPVRILAGATDLKSVLETCAVLKTSGFMFKQISVLENGTLDLTTLKMMLSGSADIDTIMTANSKTGVISPVRGAITY